MDANPREHTPEEIVVELAPDQPGSLAKDEVGTGYDVQLQQENLAGLKLVRVYKAVFAPAVFLVMLGWMVFVALIVVWSGMGWWWLSLSVSDTVLTALVAGATVNVIGLFAAVMLHLFPKSG